jgi:hypothetical protein
VSNKVNQETELTGGIHFGERQSLKVNRSALDKLVQIYGSRGGVKVPITVKN